MKTHAVRHMFECEVIELRSCLHAVCTFVYDGNETLGDVGTVTEKSTLIRYKAFIDHNGRVGRIRVVFQRKDIK